MEGKDSLLIDEGIEYERQARAAKSLKDKISLYKKAAAEYKRLKDQYACDVCITAAYSAIEQGDYNAALDCYLEAGNISYEIASDNISWYIESWWIAKKLGKLEKVTRGIENMLERIRQRAAENEQLLISYYRAASKYALMKASFEDYAGYVDKICSQMNRINAPPESIALEYSSAAYNLRMVFPHKAIEFFKNSIAWNKKSDHPEAKDLIPKLDHDCRLTRKLMKLNLNINPNPHPVLLEYMSDAKVTDPYKALGALEKAAYNARQELRYMKFLESERLYAILAEAYLLKGEIDACIKQYMRAVESIDALMYFKDVSPLEIPDAINRCINYHLVCGKIESARDNYFLSAEHFYNAGKSAKSINENDRSLKYYEIALRCVTMTSKPMENWDIQRREFYRDIKIAIEEVKKLS